MGKVNNAEFRNPDILIKDTQIVDGTGKPAYKGNVAIQGDRIVAVGDTENDADYPCRYYRHDVPTGRKFCHAGRYDCLERDVRLFPGTAGRR